MSIKEWWSNKNIGIKFLYGILIGAMVFTLIIMINTMSNSKGLQIDKAYIKAIKPCQQEVNDVYLTKMIEFADKCNGEQKFFKLTDYNNKLIGVTLFCTNPDNKFTFYFSDKWRQEQYGFK